MQMNSSDMLIVYGTLSQQNAASAALKSSPGCEMSVNCHTDSVVFTLTLTKIKSASRKRADTDTAILARKNRALTLTEAGWLPTKKDLNWKLEIELPEISPSLMGKRLGIDNIDCCVKNAAEQIMKTRGIIDGRWARVYTTEKIAELVKMLLIKYYRFGQTLLRDSLTTGWVRSGNFSHYLHGDSIIITIGKQKSSDASGYSEIIGEQLYLHARITRV
jgi:hypothetical protein